MSPPTGEKKNDNSTPTRPIRMPPELWTRAGVVAEYLGTDRSALVREFFRWLTFEEGAKMPRRPSAPPEELPDTVALPAAVHEVIDGSGKTKAPGRTRYVMSVDARIDAVRAALEAADLNTGPSYMETTPLQLSTFDRSQAVKMHQALTDAGIAVIA